MPESILFTSREIDNLHFYSLHDEIYLPVIITQFNIYMHLPRLTSVRPADIPSVRTSWWFRPQLHVVRHQAWPWWTTAPCFQPCSWVKMLIKTSTTWKYRWKEMITLKWSEVRSNLLIEMENWSVIINTTHTLQRRTSRSLAKGCSYVV